MYVSMIDWIIITRIDPSLIISDVNSQEFFSEIILWTKQEIIHMIRNNISEGYFGR